MPNSKPELCFINPAAMPKPMGYTQVVEVSHAKLVYISGQVAFDKSGNVVGKGDMRAQAFQVFQNIEAALEAVGSTWADVIKMNHYVVEMSNLAAIREVRDQFVNIQNPPASTLVQVSRLVREELLIESEAVVMIPDLE
ncbi:RidA family protein [Candidatus Acetothermia bacterium]|nr:RidA family protein [Candidatus Acetothermia bacterium]